MIIKFPNGQTLKTTVSYATGYRATGYRAAELTLNGSDLLELSRKSSQEIVTTVRQLAGRLSPKVNPDVAKTFRFKVKDADDGTTLSILDGLKKFHGGGFVQPIEPSASKPNEVMIDKGAIAEAHRKAIMQLGDKKPTTLDPSAEMQSSTDFSKSLQDSLTFGIFGGHERIEAMADAHSRKSRFPENPDSDLAAVSVAEWLLFVAHAAPDDLKLSVLLSTVSDPSSFGIRGVSKIDMEELLFNLDQKAIKRQLAAWPPRVAKLMFLDLFYELSGFTNLTSNGPKKV